MEKLKLYSDVLATWVAILGALLSGALALSQYINNSSAEQAKASLAYVDRFSRSPILDARHRLNMSWDGKAEAVFSENAVGEHALAQFVIETIHNNNLAGDIDLIVDFYEDLHACTCAKACDESLAMRFFGRYARDFHGLLFPYLAKQRERLKDNSFGRSVELFAKNQRPGQSLCQYDLPPASRTSLK